MPPPAAAAKTAARLWLYARLGRFHTPAGALLLLWPTLWGLWAAAGGYPGGKWLAVFVAGVFCARALGCVVNDMADKNLDAAVARTAGRPLAAGRVGMAEAAAVAAFYALLCFGLWLQLPPAGRAWALAGLALALAYPAAKRLMPMPQAVLGVAFGFGILVASATLRGGAPNAAAWLLFVGNFFWVLGYDTIYAMADKEEDRAYGGVGSAALLLERLLGKADIKAVAVFYAAAVLWLCGVGVTLNYGVAYQVALLAALAASWRFWRLYKTREPRACMAAFYANHWFGAFVFAGIAAAA